MKKVLISILTITLMVLFSSADALAQMSDDAVMIEYSGLRPGEKLHEEVLSNKENTIPTGHDRIMIAKVRSYDYAHAREVVDELERLSRAVEAADMIRLMKRTVPEFKSRNSRFEVYDREIEEEK